MSTAPAPTTALPVAELAARYGTPLYVYDLDRVRAARRDLFAALPEGFTLFYALKANPHPDIVRALRSGEGPACRAEISSTGELDAALEAGFGGADCLYTGPGKTYGELAETIDRGVRLFSAESVTDLEHIGAAAAAAGVVADCLLRVNAAGVGATTTSIRMTGAPSQFGFDSETLPGLAPALTTVPGTRIAGAHFFPLSNAKDEDGLIAEFRHTITLAAELEKHLGVTFRVLDIGGGFAAPYGVRGERPRYPHLRGALEGALDAHFPRWRDGGLEVACESGRHLVADGGRLLCAVVNTKVSRGRRFVVLDAGINAFGGMSGLGRLLPVTVEPCTDDTDQGPARDLPTERASLVGPLCTPGDLLGREIELPAGLSAGDVVSVPNAGSYGVTASLLMFLGRPAPTEVCVRDGEVVSVTRLEHRRVVPGDRDRTDRRE
ncbi:type III PLP-dependent enzyme [Streptomyces sp. NBC_01217]|uniref:type III PLP-dependent enzyme n=1 Tax=Streptomyces sp. NBC_01217 TaxID=2903779 RepID=UPI002E0D4FE5|nr:type III PLP-dependent enzyme [Streptomyces sp. NBC_01217]